MPTLLDVEIWEREPVKGRKLDIRNYISRYLEN